MHNFFSWARVMMKPWFFMLMVFYFWLLYMYVDRPLAIYFHHLNIKETWPLLSHLTHLGESAIYLVFFACMGLYFRYIKHNKKWELRGWFLGLCVFVPTVICLVAKILLGRARPELFFSDQMYGFYGPHVHSLFWSFPSGHTTTLMSLLCACVIIWPRHRVVFMIVGSALIALRVVLTSHYLSDVLATMYLSVLEVFVLCHFTQALYVEPPHE